MQTVSTSRPLSSVYHLTKRVAVGLAVWGLASTAAQAQTWMVSTTAYIKLGVLDKYNSLGGYKAVFVVIPDRGGQQYTLEKTVPKGESGADVLFPSEASEADYFKNAKGLAAQPTPGHYTWECRVNGKRVVGGNFDYPATANDIVTVTK